MTKDSDDLHPDLLTLARALGRYQAHLDLRHPSDEAGAEVDPDDASHEEHTPNAGPRNQVVIEMGCLSHKTIQGHPRSFAGLPIL